MRGGALWGGGGLRSWWDWWSGWGLGAVRMDGREGGLWLGGGGRRTRAGAGVHAAPLECPRCMTPLFPASPVARR